MQRTFKAAIPAAVMLIALAAGGCAALANTATSAAKSSPTAHAPFVGYKWLVTSIISHGKQTPVPNQDLINKVYVLFTPNGQFVADDPINIHEGHYRLVGDGFTTIGPIISSAAGYGGGTPATLVVINAISAFNNGVHATATVTGNRLVISVAGFLLNCERDGTSGRSLLLTSPDAAGLTPLAEAANWASPAKMGRRAVAESVTMTDCAADDYDDRRTRVRPGLPAA
jgi:hypothetical protein